MNCLNKPGICDPKAAPLESPAAPPNSQGSHLSGQQQIFIFQRMETLAKILLIEQCSELLQKWERCTILLFACLTFHHGLVSSWVNMCLTSHSMYAITDLLDEYFMLKNWAVRDGLPPKYELSRTSTQWVRTAVHGRWA